MKYTACFLLSLFTACAFAQQVQQPKEVTMIFLTRHAEKDLKESSNDPGLDTIGIQRSRRLAAYLKDAGISAVYGTNTKRAMLTGKPLADALNLPVLTYGNDLEKETNEFARKHTGGRILVVGHSNTVPAMLNLFAGSEKYQPTEDYGALFLVILSGSKLQDILRINY